MIWLYFLLQGIFFGGFVYCLIRRNKIDLNPNRTEMDVKMANSMTNTMAVFAILMIFGLLLGYGYGFYVYQSARYLYSK